MPVHFADTMQHSQEAASAPCLDLLPLTSRPGKNILCTGCVRYGRPKCIRLWKAPSDA